MSEENEIVQVDVEVMGGLIGQITRQEIDMQVATAKKYPRSIEKFVKEVETLATYNQETAAECHYRLPARSGSNKGITGPSVRFAEILQSAWENIRVGARIIDIGEAFVTAEGVAFDVEKNSFTTSQIRRRITGKNGKRYGDDMIVTTCNAACAIARRNAILEIIPKAYIKKIETKIKSVALGDIATLPERRKEMMDRLKDMSISKQMVIDYLEINGLDDIDLQKMAELAGLYTAIQEGDISAKDAFKPKPKTVDPEAQKAEMFTGEKKAENANVG